MFVLESANPPATAAELTTSLNASLARWIDHAGAMASVEGEYPQLSAIRIDVSNGLVRTGAKAPDVKPVGAIETGPSAGEFSMIGHPLFANGASGNIDLRASAVSFGYGRNRSGELLVTVREAKEGALAFKIDQRNLEAAAMFAVRTLAGGAGVTIQKVEIRLAATGPRAVDVNMKVTGKKFMSVIISVRGRLELDEHLNALISGLRAEGEGVGGSMAAGLLRPQLQKIEGQRFPLMAFSLGTVRLRDFTVNAEDGFAVQATFGETGAG